MAENNRPSAIVVVGGGFLGVVFLACLMGGAFAPKPTANAAEVAPALVVPQVSVPAPPTPQAAPSPSVESIMKKAFGVNASDADLVNFFTVADENKGVKIQHLQKNSERYKGDPWTFTGRIIEIHENEEGSVARVSLNDYRADQIMFVKTGFQTDYVQGDVVDVAGILFGDFSYTSQAGAELSIPMIMARAVRKGGEFARLKRKRVKSSD